ncbi:MAG: ATP-binding protein [candidate division Zixibacteria bacterium]|nr:ATP-binding protein [candidate division Zixibacteria bacterium]
MDKPIITDNTMVIPSNQEYLSDVDIFIEGSLRGFGASESIIADIAISVSELVNNAILHGNKSSVSKRVTVKLVKSNGSVTISVSDQGDGFQAEEVADPVADENLLREVGRGIFIVRALMDKVDIESSTIGTTISITKAI